jgi:transposase-like protein
VRSSEDIVQKINEQSELEVQPNEVQRRFATVVSWIGQQILGVPVDCTFFSRCEDIEQFNKLADFSTTIPVIRWNVLCATDFEKPLAPANLAVMAHEFAHYKCGDHDTSFHREVESVAGKLAHLFLIKRDQIPYINDMRIMSGKTIFIICTDCGTKREVKVQDAFLVKRCKECQKKFSRRRKAELLQKARRLLETKC